MATFGPGAAIALSVLGLSAARSKVARSAADASAATGAGHGAHGSHARIVAAPPASPAVAPFAVPLPIPPTLRPAKSDATTDYYEITMRQAEATILPGRRTTIWGYDGIFPGPTIRAQAGRRVVVRQTNALPEETVVHLHGGHVPASSDGHPRDAIAPGASRDYVYPNSQEAATLWYHDHALLKTAGHIWKGLAGVYLIGDEAEAALGLPGGEYDIPLLVQDRRFNADGSFYYPSPGAPEAVNGLVGDVMLVNGAPQPYLKVANRKYRFRLLNGSNAQTMTFALQWGATTVPLTQIASDAGLLPAPIARPTIALGQAERAEVIVDFAAFPLGAQLVLVNTAGGPGTTEVLRFDVARNEPDPSALPPILRPFTPLDPATATATRNVILVRDPQSGRWTLGGYGYDPARIDAQVTLGATEIWQFVNADTVPHPMHLHHSPFQILDRNGVRPSATSGEIGWKDTVTVAPGETVRVIVRFTDHVGTFLFHCHHLEHEDHEMMGQFTVSYTHQGNPRRR
jgi:spore coat protein A, manganese oxidase